ncbi:MAG TPA: CoA transferase [Candidatus Binatia bacterium]|nr:CoA transferase [Candidatus Binatia bacterium]
MPQGMDHVLSDLRVLDLTRALAGPSCTRMLAEMGAEVIKVEPAPSGELARRFSNYRNNRSLYYIQQNLGKKSLCVNLRDPRGLALVTELVPQVDVVVENFKAGVIAEMGLGYERLQELRPGIILCSISALGQSGPLANKPGYDYIAQAYSGVTSMIGEPDDAPYIPLVGMGDVSTGVHAALAIVSALRYRDRTGEGQHLDIALLDVYYHYHEANVHMYSGSGGTVQPTRAGRHMTYACPGGVFRGKGGYLVVMSFLHHWKDLCQAMGRPELADDPNYSTDQARLQRRMEVVKIIEDWLQNFSDVASAVAHLEKFQVPVAPVLSIAETVNHPHHRARGTVRTVHDRLHGDFDMPGMPLKFSRFPKDLPLEAATLGQHNEEILTSYLGRSAAEVQRLREAGVLVEKEI